MQVCSALTRLIAANAKLTFSRFPLCLFFPGHKSQREDLDSVLFILEVRIKPFLTVPKKSFVDNFRRSLNRSAN